MFKMVSTIGYRIIVFNFPIQQNNQGKRIEHIPEIPQIKAKNLSKSFHPGNLMGFVAVFASYRQVSQAIGCICHRQSQYIKNRG